MQHTAREAAHRGMKAVRKGILANILLAIIKAAAGYWGHSYALIADALESASDIMTSSVVWVGLLAAARAPDANHPYGHGKAEPIAGMFVGVVLVVGAVLIAVQAFANIRQPHPGPEAFTAWVLVAVVIVKEWLFRQVIAEAEQVHSTAVKGDAVHHRSDAFTSLAALVGILVALIGGEGYESADDWAALLASAVIAYNAWQVFKPAFAEVMDEAAPAELIRQIRQIAREVPGVRDVEKCYVRKVGLRYYVDLHVIVDGQLTVQSGHQIGHAVKDALRRYMPAIEDVLTHVEPDRYSVIPPSTASLPETPSSQ